MWEFTEYKLSETTRWTWARVSTNGRTIQKSPVAYHSFGSALKNAMQYGFDAGNHDFRLIELA